MVVMVRLFEEIDFIVEEVYCWKKYDVRIYILENIFDFLKKVWLCKYV